MSLVFLNKNCKLDFNIKNENIRFNDMERKGFYGLLEWSNNILSDIRAYVNTERGLVWF